tara:strand:- start:271 stop:483 length:213 start_codon:yes stop_codon:yes gene_type:complete
MSDKAKKFLAQLNSNPKYNGFWQDFNQYCNNFEVPDKNYFVESLPLLYKKKKMMVQVIIYIKHLLLFTNR